MGKTYSHIDIFIFPNFAKLTANIKL